MHVANKTELRVEWLQGQGESPRGWSWFARTETLADNVNNNKDLKAGVSPSDLTVHRYLE
jgi:hypothetical protein